MTEKQPRDGALSKAIQHPNTLTMMRVAAVPLIVILMMFPESHLCTFMAGIIFSIAAITDYFDGYLARRHGLVSDFGKVMDPIADKLLVSSSLVMLSALGWVEAWIVCIIIGREFAVSGLRSIIAQNKLDVSASMLGKYKTGFQIAMIIPLLIHYRTFGLNVQFIGWVFKWGALVYTLWSGADYFIRFRRLLRK